MGRSAAADVKGTCIPKCLGRAGELIRTRNLENAPSAAGNIESSRPGPAVVEAPTRDADARHPHHASLLAGIAGGSDAASIASSEKGVAIGESAAADVEGMYVLRHATPT